MILGPATLGHPQRLDDDLLVHLGNLEGEWLPTALPSDGGMVHFCTCGGVRSVVIQYLEYVGSVCCVYGNTLVKVSSDLPGTWLSTDLVMSTVDPWVE